MNPLAPLDAFFSAIPILVIVAVVLAVVLLIWVIYTVVWMGVKRGLEEYYGPGEYRGFSLPAQSDQEPRESPSRDRRHRSGRLSR